MRNLTVGICVSAILAGCGGGGGGSTSSTPTSNTSATPAVVKDPLKVITGAAYDAADEYLNPKWVIADFNKDGTTDVFTRYESASAYNETNPGSSSVRFFLGDSTGGFTQSKSIFPETYSTTLINKVVAADLNNDGGTDIILATAGSDPYVNGVALQTGHTGNYVQILTYTPTGYKLSKITNSPYTWSHHVSTGDINGDYLPDAFVNSMTFTEPFFIMGDSSGSFKADLNRFPKQTFKFRKTVTETFVDGTPKKWENTAYTASAMLDANGDGHMDIAMFAAAGTKNSIVYLNDGNGNYSDYNTITLPKGPYGDGYEYYESSTTTDKRIAVGTINLDAIAVDINNDGKKDLIVLSTQSNQVPSNYVYYRGSSVQILINNGKEFVDETKLRTNFVHTSTSNYSQYDSIEYVDVNNDKNADILLHRSQINPSDNSLPTRILINDGKGNFTERQYPKSLPVGVLTVVSPNHYIVLVTVKENGKYMQRVDDVYYDWTLGQNLFP